MNIVDKTRTRIAHSILSALGVVHRTDLNDTSGLRLLSPDVIEDTFQWHASNGVWQVTTTVTVDVQIEQVSGRADSL